MANIRIKDLANTASSTASDDFIAVDGATNGTRKLNAYSPSFGGTLTVNGTGLSAFAGNVETVGAAASDRFFQTVASGTLATAIGQNTSGSTNAFGIASGNSYVGNAQNYGLAFSTNAVTRMTISNGSTGGNVSISSTTASTSTSTGALVVGGGLGVAGALYVGSKGQFQSNDDALSLKYSTDGGSCLLAWKNTSGTTLWSIGGGIDTRQDELVFRRGSTTVLNLNNSNNATFAGTLTVNNSFGVGAAPTSSWASGYYALEVGNTSTRRAALFANGDNNFWLVSNAYFDGSSFKRFAASSATGYEQVNGEHKWSYAASGSAGASISFTTGMTLNSSGNLQIAATTASTSTSTGALVVSGGVGVAGAIYAGGVIGIAGDTRYGVAKVYNSSTGDMFGLEQVSGAQTGDVPATRVFTSSAANSALDFGKYTSATAFTNWLRIGTNGNVLVNTTTDSGGKLQINKANGGNTTGAANAAISLPTDESTIQGPGAYTQIRMGGNLVLGSSNETLIQVNQVNAIKITSSQQVQVPTTTASTSTSTGALVVSGGVGVAGALYVGGVLACTSSGISQINGTLLVGAQAASGASLDVQTASGTASTLRLYQQGVSNWVWSVPASTDALVLSQYGTTEAMRFDSNRKATFAATIKTAAPSGGTAAEWKLGTVATVSPTSPNRTIEVDIGGTIYYIHAKTTNN